MRTPEALKDGWISQAQAAVLLNCGTSNVSVLIRKGLLRPSQIGQSLFFKEREVLQLAKQRETRSARPARRRAAR